MKIEIVIDGIIFQNHKKGGISRLFKEVLPRICDIDNSINVCLFTSGPKLQPLPEHNNIEYFEIPNIKKLLRPQRLFRDITQKIEETIVNNQFRNLDGAIWHSTYFTTVNEWRGPVVVTVYDMIYERFPVLFNRPEEIRFRKQKQKSISIADKLICISNTTKSELISYLGIDSEKCSITPLACGSAFRRINLPYDSKQVKPFLLYVGKRYHYKNFFGLLKAHSKWRHRSEIDLVIVGDEHLTNDELRMINEFNLKDYVRFQYNLTDEQLCILYNQALALVFPSLYEGFGLPLLEAMNCGCPIVASKIPSTIEIAEEIPIYFDPQDEDQLLAALDQALEEGKNYARIQRGFTAASKYSWDKTAEKTLEVYRSLV